MRSRSSHRIRVSRPDSSLAYWRKNNVGADPEWQKRAQAHAERAVAGNEQLAVAHIAQGAALMLTGLLRQGRRGVSESRNARAHELGAAVAPRQSRGRPEEYGGREQCSRRAIDWSAGMGAARTSGHTLVPAGALQGCNRIVRQDAGAGAG